MDLARQLAESLRRVRLEAGVTQTTMARKLGVSQATLNRLESGSQNVTLRTLQQLCRSLDCGLEDLFGGQLLWRVRSRRPARR